MAGSSIPGDVPREGEAPLTDDQVPGIDNLWRDVDTVFELERNQVRFPILDFIKSRFFPRRRADIGEVVVVIDRRNQKRIARSLEIEAVIENQLRGVVGPKPTLLLGSMLFRRLNLIAGL